MWSGARAILAGLALLILAASFGAYGYETTMQPVMTSVTVSEMVELIRSMSGDGVALLTQDANDPDNASVEIRFSSGRRAWIQFYNKHRTVTYDALSSAMASDRTSYSCILLQAGFAVSSKPTAAAINDWNHTKIFGRASRDGELDPMFDAWFYFDGGVTVDAVKAFVKHCDTVITVFYTTFVTP